MTLFWSKGFEPTSLNDLLQATGLSMSSLYETFGSKHELFLRAFQLYKKDRMDGFSACLSQPNAYLAISTAFQTVLDGNGNQMGCMTANEAIELAPHDPKLQELVESDFHEIEQVFLEAIERGKQNGSLRTGTESRKRTRFLTVSLQEINVMIRAKAQGDVMEDTISVILEKLNERK
ncbi:TetR/AcrR family transcriptional regulator [Cohnella hashimotonis]|uniref:TetR/AcrR family transcriptional regulator n=1 Tax=Cohnella hashimotonis TaxID=2826895 RepID=A0ABT6TQU4_9BACL|nr:TetR/AcrR family transcriptional regulator [Cohnella hashimotonis]MDI4649094.1 TetR/AcrR family transcriptional regulator [Cohnella hashimotonis]